ncbi:hypothetical protein [Haliangium sp.]|uniref:hypothetical protein n=1 Tax=Haliangium sp. TaxID=2663208 RepID=UPI003D1184BC
MTQSDRPGTRFLALARMSMSALERELLRGTTPALEDLAGWTFRGANTPTWARLLGIRKFIKGFEPASGPSPAQLIGYNLPVHQDRIDQPWRPKSGRGGRPPRRFGFYRVTPVDAGARDNAYLHALLLDYGAGPNPRLDPSRGLRDYLVQVDPENPDLFLGKAYYALGPARLGVSFFVLERLAPSGDDPATGAGRRA